MRTAWLGGARAAGRTFALFERPAAPQDCETAAIWLAEHAYDRFGATKLAIGGFSAGATLAAATLLRLRDRGISAVDAAVLQFGTYDLSALTPAGRLIADEYFLEAYTEAACDRTHPDLSPIYADLVDLPPVLGSGTRSCQA